MSFGDYTLTDLEYADDTTLFCNTLDELRNVLEIFNEEAKNLGLSVNWSKTELMHIGDGPDPPPLLFNNIPVNFVSTFTYLGSTVSGTGDLSVKINQRRGLASSVL